MKKTFEIIFEGVKDHKVSYPLEVYKLWFKLNKWEWSSDYALKKKGLIRGWTNEYIDSRIDPGKIKKRNKTIIVKNIVNLRDFHSIDLFSGLSSLAIASMTWRKYVRLVERAYPKISS